MIIRLGHFMQQHNHHKPCKYCGCLIDRQTSLCTYCGRLVKVEEKTEPDTQEPQTQLAFYQNPLALVFLLITLFYLAGLGLSMRLKGYDPVTEWWTPDPAILQYLGSHSLVDTWQAHEAWRLLTASFLHTNLIHVCFMTLLAGYIGTLSLLNLELNRKRFWITLFLTATIGGLCSLIWQRLFAGSYTSMGLSPILFGFLAMNLSHFHLQYDLLLAKRFKQLLIIAYSVAILLGVSGWVHVDHAAHIGATLAGLFCGWHFEFNRDRPRWRILEQIFLFVCIVGFLYGIFEVIQNIAPLLPQR